MIRSERLKEQQKERIKQEVQRELNSLTDEEKKLLGLK